MTWEEVCDDPCLQDLPYKIELNQWGNVVLRPVRNRHGELQFKIGHLLQLQRPDGVCHRSPAVETVGNVKVPDVSWISLARSRGMEDGVTFTIAPEICVGVLSPGNMPEEQLHKSRLYFEAGAKEFWLCDELGSMRYFNAAGPLERSALCPDFPVRVEIRD